MSDNYKTIDELVNDINSKLGEKVIVRGSETRQKVPRLSTGILAYDLALGGGWAANQWNEIVGEESSGKTAIAYRTIAYNMERDPEFQAMWVAAEEYVPEYAESFGIDPDRLWVVETNEMETVLELILKTVKNRAVDVIVLDSLPALVPNEEAEKSMEENSVALGARLLARFFRKSSKEQRRNHDGSDRDCTLIAINQWRNAIGVMFGDPRTTPGGNAKDYFYFTRMEVRRDDWLKEGTAIDKRVGQVIKTRVFKNKTYRPQQVAQVDFYFATTADGRFTLGDFDLSKDIVNVALALDLFEGRYKFNGERIAKTKDELYQVVSEDTELREALKESALATLYEGGVSSDDDEFDVALAAEVVDGPDLEEE